MKLVWHIFLKDLRRFAPALGLITLLMAGQFCTGWMIRNGSGMDESEFSRMEVVAFLFLALEVVANFFVVALLIGQDPVRSTSAFWLTRPISGGRLLAAKLLGIFAMCGVLPVLVSLPWWLLNGYGAPELLAATADTLCWQALIVAVPLLLGVLTDGLPRLLLWTGVTWFAILTWVKIVDATNLREIGVTSGIVWSRAMVSLVLGALGIALVVVLQYRTRRLARSLIVTGGFAAAMLVVAAIWPWDWLPAWDRRVNRGARVPMTLTEHSTLKFEYRGAHAPSLAQKLPETTMAVGVDLVLRGLPRDRAVSFRRADQTWSWRDGASFQSPETGFHLFFEPAAIQSGEQSNPAIRQALRLPARPDAADEPTVMWSSVPRPLGQRMAENPPAYTAEITYGLARPVLAMESSLQPGEWVQQGPFSACVTHFTDVGPKGQGGVIGVVTTRPRFALFNAMRWRLELATRPGEIIPLLVNRSGEGWARTLSRGNWTQSVNIGTVAITWGALAVPASPSVTLAGSSIAWVDLRDFEVHWQTVQVERFELRP